MGIGPVKTSASRPMAVNVFFALKIAIMYSVCQQYFLQCYKIIIVIRYIVMAGLGGSCFLPPPLKRNI